MATDSYDDSNVGPGKIYIANVDVVVQQPSQEVAAKELMVTQARCLASGWRVATSRF